MHEEASDSAAAMRGMYASVTGTYQIFFQM